MSSMTTLLSNIDIEQPADTDVVLVLLRHRTRGDMCWAAIQGETLLTWDGWYGPNPGKALKALVEVDPNRESATYVAAKQLGLAMLSANIFPGEGSVLWYIQSHMDDETWTEDIVQQLRQGEVVSYLVLGPALQTV